MIELYKYDKDLIKLGFKRCWLSDKSGYWMIRNFKKSFGDFQIYCESDTNRLYICAKWAKSNSMGYKLYEPIKKFKFSIDQVKKLIKMLK